MKKFNPPSFGPKILIFDIESSNLKGDFGVCLCVGFKWYGQKQVHIISISDYRAWLSDPSNDKGVVRDFAKVFEQAEIVVGYYSKGFDVKFLNARLMTYGFNCLPPVPHVDLYFAAKRSFALSRKSMANVGYHLRVPDKKTPLEGREWVKASTGNLNALKGVIRHCKADIIVTEKLYEKMRPLIRQHPPVTKDEACDTCGHTNFTKPVIYLANTKKNKYRMRCKVCNSWIVR